MGRKRGASKKAKISTNTPDSTMPPEELETSNVFSHDMDTLECEICSLPFDLQIFMCKNGHAACGNCCIGMNRKCSCCHERIGDFRCRAMEKVLAGMTRPCKFSKHGCEETLKFTELRSHEEEACPYASYSCPFNGCAHRGALLYDHVRDEHAPAHSGDTGGLLRGASVTLRRDAPVHALLHSDRVSVILLLNGGDVLTGRSLSLVRICPHPKPGQEDEEVEYRMVVVTRHEPGTGIGTGSPSLTASGKVQHVRRLEGYQPQHFLFVPDAFWGSSGSVVVTVTTTVTVHL